MAHIWWEITDTHILGALSNNFRTIHKKDPVKRKWPKLFKLMIIAFELISKILCSSDWIKFPCVESLKSDIRGMMRSLVMNTDLSQPLNLHLSSSNLQAVLSALSTFLALCKAAILQILCLVISLKSSILVTNWHIKVNFCSKKRKGGNESNLSVFLPMQFIFDDP